MKTGQPRSHQDALVIVAKYPEPGQVKTRLGTAIGAENAACLYRAFLADLAQRFEQAQHGDGYRLHWACAPSDRPMTAVLGPHTRVFTQCGEHFADRLFNVCQDMRARRYERLVIIGSDSPHLPAAVVRRAFAWLHRWDVVLGPAEDGGYYLVGLHLDPEPPDLFRGIQMSTPGVLAETVRRAEELGCSVALLASTFDVDEVADLSRLVDVLHQQGPAAAPHTARALQQMTESVRLTRGV